MKPYWTNGRATLWQGHVLDALAAMEAQSVHCAVTSPPYWGLRDYDLPSLEWSAVSYAPMAGLPEIEIPGCDPECGHAWGEEQAKAGKVSHGQGGSTLTGGHESWGNRDGASQGQYCQLCGGWRGSLGLERTVEMFVGHIVLVARALWRVLRDDGAFWLNFGDASSTGKKLPIGDKQVIGIPWRIAFALQADNWVLRSDIIWAKGVSFCPTYSGSCMPESVRDRPTKGHEYVFLLSKNKRYFYDGMAVREAISHTTLSRFGSADVARTGPNGQDTIARSLPTGQTRTLGASSSGRNLRSVWTINPGAYPNVVSYGSYRIASPDCPDHDCRAFLARVLQCDEQRAASQSDHNPDTDVCPSPGQEGAVVSIPVSPSWFPSGEFSATLHSMQSHKRATELGQDVIFYGTPSDRTEYKKFVSRCVSKYDRKRGNNTEGDASSSEQHSDPLEQTLYRIVCTETYDKPPDSCTCHYTGRLKKSQGHFAVFPPKLVEPMIKAGTSAKGCCPECGASWVRVTEKGPLSGEAIIQDTERPAASVRGVSKSSILRTNGRTFRPTTTTGWIPTCSCSGLTIIGDQPAKPSRKKGQSELSYTADLTAWQMRLNKWHQHWDALKPLYDAEPTVPCTVLDPFAGTFTTGKEAIRLGRHAVGIELSKTYCDDHIIPRLSEPLFEWAQEQAEQDQWEPEPEIEQLGLL